MRHAWSGCSVSAEAWTAFSILSARTCFLFILSLWKSLVLFFMSQIVPVYSVIFFGGGVLECLGKSPVTWFLSGTFYISFGDDNRVLLCAACQWPPGRFRPHDTPRTQLSAWVTTWSQTSLTFWASSDTPGGFNDKFYSITTWHSFFPTWLPKDISTLLFCRKK